jgi:phage/plasmid-like protein (TIGR03299 family)
MSQHDSFYLNHYVLLNKEAWHTDRTEWIHGVSNIYDGFVPVQEVIDRLFFKAVEATPEARVKGTEDYEVPVDKARGIAAAIENAADRNDWAAVSNLCRQLDETATGDHYVTGENYKAIVRPKGSMQFGLSAERGTDPGGIVGIHSPKYSIHQYEEWLIGNISKILSGQLGIMSAAMFKFGAYAFVQVTLEEWRETPSGVRFKPVLMATTSHDGTFASDYRVGNFDAVCDNTHAAAMNMDIPNLRVKHTKNSEFKLENAQQALDLMDAQAGAFEAQVEEWCNTEVTTAQWDEFLATLVPLTEKNGEEKTGRGLTMAENKQEELRELYAHDSRVNRWKDSKWGVVQAVNTWATHCQQVKGAERLERNLERAMEGGFDDVQAGTLKILDPILATA